MAITLSEEQQQQIQQMDVESLAKFVFRFLKENPYLNAPHRYDFSFTFLGIREALFPDASTGQYRHDHVQLLEAIVLLERRGLVVRDFSYPPTQSSISASQPSMTDPPDRFAVHLTSIGMKSNFDDEILLLVDKPQKIVDALEQEIGTLDNVVRQYYLESLRAYQEELYISSVICLGAASERAIHWLAESVKDYCPTVHQKNIENKLNGNISDLTKYLSDTIIPNIFGNDKKFAGELKNRLDGLATVYRENRNDAGHPTRIVNKSWLREDQDRLLIYFRRYITTICKAIEECRANNKPTTTTN